MAVLKCSECKKVFNNINNFREHERTHASTSTKSPVKRMKRAFKERIITICFTNQQHDCLIPELFLEEACEPLEKEVEYFLGLHEMLKINMELHAIYAKFNVDDEENSLLEVKTFQTKMSEILHITTFKKIFIEKKENILQKMDEFQERDSGWTLVQILKIELNINKYQPLKGSSFIPLPYKLAVKNACINVKNTDEYCFKWAVISAMARIPNAHRTQNYSVDIESPKIVLRNHELNFEGLCFPLKLRDICIFERHNNDISINVFGYDTEKDLVVGPYYKTKGRKLHHINLMFLQKFVGGNTISHYVWIKNISR